MKNVLLFGHTGSDNRGCEAIVKSTADLFKLVKVPVSLASFDKKQDIRAGIQEFKEVIEYNTVKRWSLRYIFGVIYQLITGKKTLMYYFIQKPIYNVIKDKVAFSVGGDTYCYGKTYNNLYMSQYARNRSIPCVLWGCSVEKDIISPSFVKELKQYSMIFPREKKTYQYLKEAGIDSKKLFLICDPAFCMEAQQVELPDEFETGNTVGINMSPLVQSCGGELAVKNYYKLLDYIIGQTDMKIALIPHVYNGFTQDLVAMKPLYEKYRNTERVMFFTQDYNTRQIKYIASMCRFLVAARTHLSIAGYSTGIPTLVTGYSVKAKGIAEDIFDRNDSYTLSVQEFKSDNELLNKFVLMASNESEIRQFLKDKMPSYSLSVQNAVKYIYETYIK